MQARKICGFSGLAFSRMGVKESGLFSGRQTIWNALRFALGINSRKIILDFANPAGLRPRRICFFTGEGVTGSGIGCCWPAAKAQQIKCLLRQRSPPGSWRAATEGPFKSAEAENTVKRSSRRTGVNLQYFRVEPTSLGSERGEQPLSRCGERGVQRERGGSRNTPLTLWPSGATPAAMPLAKAIGPAPRDCTLHEKHSKKAPAMRMHSGCLEGFCGDAQWVVPMSTARSASFFTTASTAFSRPRAIWCRSMLGVPRGLLTTCSMA